MSGARLTRRACLVLACAAALAAYAQSLGNGFAYDDVPVILLDTRVHSLGNLPAILARPYWAAAGAELAIWRPLTTLSFAADWSLSGGSPAWFHLANVLWHAAACGLAFLLLSALFPTPAALAGALLFAVHPVHVEAVANVVGRAELIAAVFTFGACLVWDRRDGPRPQPRTVLAVSALFLLALFAKESGVMLPVLLLLVDAARGRWTLQRADARGYARAVGPAFACLALALLAYLALRAAVLDGIAPERVHAAADVLERRSHLLLTSLQAWPEYLRLLVFPRTLLIDYGPRVIMPATTWTASAVLGLTTLIGLSFGGLLALARGHGRTASGLLWLPAAVLPVSNLLFTTGILVAERTLYVPSFAIAIAAAGAASALPRVASPMRRRVAVALASAVLLLFTARTMARVPEWESTERIFASQLRDRPDSYRAHWTLGRAARQTGDHETARRHYDEALRLWPFRESMVVEAAAFAIQDGRLEEGRAIARFGAERWAGNLDLQRMLAAASLSLGDTTTARAALAAGLRAHPADSLLLLMRGALEAMGTGDTRDDP